MSPHDALDALTATVVQGRVNWVLDAGRRIEQASGNIASEALDGLPAGAL